MLGEPVRGAVVLDLFAGSGALGIEALSRGAASATFVERDPRALATLRANLAALELTAGARAWSRGALIAARVGRSDIRFGVPRSPIRAGAALADGAVARAAAGPRSAAPASSAKATGARRWSWRWRSCASVATATP